MVREDQGKWVACEVFIKSLLESRLKGAFLEE